MGKMQLPPKTPGTSNEVLEDVSSVVIVGANGTGKSRLGAWIDNLSGVIVHRVSAQRALMINEYIQSRAHEQATRLLHIGSDNPSHSYNQKQQLRWQSNPIGLLIQDYDLALSCLFADHAKTGVEFRDKWKKLRGKEKVNQGVSPEVKESQLETALRIWAVVMPQRQLVAEDNKVEARLPGGQPYSGKDMSDGERVTLYLIAQCLAAPVNAIIVIDEPELHLHQAIQTKLWDEVEAARPDSVFVYITHDLAFAASRATARKIWLRSYDSTNWEWEEVAATDQFPEALVLQILGSRRPILFVEGETSSLDIAVYRALYPERLVIPRGSCDSVVSSTASLRSLPQLHHQDAYGFVDRDYRSEAELASYAVDRVFAADVAEIEHLFLVPEAVEFASKHLKRDPATDLAAAQDFLFGELRKELHVQVNDRATFQIEQRLNGFPGLKDRKGGPTEFKIAVADFLGAIDPVTIYSDSEKLYQDIIDKRDYALLLKHYNRKSLASRISRNLGLRDGEYPNLVLRILQSQEGEKLREALRSHLPGVPVGAPKTGS